MAGQGGKLWQVGMYNNDDVYVFFGKKGIVGVCFFIPNNFWKGSKTK
jgi:hypothetical protein